MKPKSKTQKKIDGAIVRVLNNVCEASLDDVEGFCWLTHHADYTNFPASLLVTCVFDNTDTMAVTDGQIMLKKRIQAGLLTVGVKFKSINQQVVFDCESACEEQDHGDWNARLARRVGRAVPRNRP